MLRFRKPLVPANLRLVVEACTVKPGCFRWIIRSTDGQEVQWSPYSFASRDGAKLSGELWMREMQASA